MIVCENAIKKYPIVCMPKPRAVIPRLISNPSNSNVFTIYADHIIPNPIPIAKNAIVSLNKTGLPVFLYPIYENIPIISPIKNPIRLKIFSNNSSNYTFKRIKLIKY